MIAGRIVTFCLQKVKEASFFFFDKKETKNQEQTIAPHRQHGIAFVQPSRATTKSLSVNN
jgi:hypothetical protein